MSFCVLKFRNAPAPDSCRERVARFADYENEVIETPRRKRDATAVIYDINIKINNKHM